MTSKKLFSNQKKMFFEHQNSPLASTVESLTEVLQLIRFPVVVKKKKKHPDEAHLSPC